MFRNHPPQSPLRGGTINPSPPSSPFLWYWWIIVKIGVYVTSTLLKKLFFRFRTSNKLGTIVKRHVVKQFGYSAASVLHSDSHVSRFTKWPPGDLVWATRGIKIAVDSVFVEWFHRLKNLLIHIISYHKSVTDFWKSGIYGEAGKERERFWKKKSF